MDLFDRLAGHDSWHTGKILEHSRKLSAEQLDAPIKGVAKVLHWEEPDRSMRELLERLVFHKEIWTAALKGSNLPANYNDKKSSSIDELISRYEKADAEFTGVLRDVRDRGAWDDVFVDALCEPAETFTFGGMFAHYITFTSYRRLTALAALRQLGLDISEMGCPTEYEQAVQPWKAVGVS